MAKVNLNDIFEDEYDELVDTPTFVKNRKKRKFDDGTSIKHTTGKSRKTKKKKNKVLELSV